MYEEKYFRAQIMKFDVHSLFYKNNFLGTQVWIWTKIVTESQEQVRLKNFLKNSKVYGSS